MLAPGTPAPGFTLPNQHGESVSLSDHAGKWVLLWWYPKASTPGCTVEGQCLRDQAEAFAAAGCVILGASFDTPEENRVFAEDQEFGYDLPSDVDRSVGAAFEVLRDEPRFAPFADRISYLIDPTGIIRRSYDAHDVAAHADAVLADLLRLQATDV